MSLDSFFPQKPLCVDLDGTLIRGHSLWQIQRPWSLRPYWPPCWPRIKHNIAESGTVGQFTYYLPLLDRLYAWKKSGASLFLVTGAPEKIAHAVAQEVSIFDDVFSSSPQLNLVGRQKAHWLVQRFGSFSFGYVGNSWQDWAVWQWASDLLLVSSCSSWLVRYVEWKKRPFQALYRI